MAKSKQWCPSCLGVSYLLKKKGVWYKCRECGEVFNEKEEPENG